MANTIVAQLLYLDAIDPEKVYFLSFIYTFLYTINHCGPKCKLKKLICAVMQVRNKRRTLCDIWYVSKLYSELVIEMATLGTLGTQKFL